MEINRKQKAYDLFKQGYNCSQAVVIAFEDLLGYDRQTLSKMSIAFGGGFGRTRNICGAVSAMGLVIGLLSNPTENPQEDKAHIYKAIQILRKAFVEINGSDNCAILLTHVKDLTNGYRPQVRDDKYYTSRPCSKFVLDSVDLLEDYLNLDKE